LCIGFYKIVTIALASLFPLLFPSIFNREFFGTCRLHPNGHASENPAPSPLTTALPPETLNSTPLENDPCFWLLFLCCCSAAAGHAIIIFVIYFGGRKSKKKSTTKKTSKK